MSPFDFRQVALPAPLPLDKTDFLFIVFGQTEAHVDANKGINCSYKSILQLNFAANSAELYVINDVGMATVTAWYAGSGGWHSDARSVPSGPLYPVKFDLTGIQRITFESSSGEFYLQTIS